MCRLELVCAILLLPVCSVQAQTDNQQVCRVSGTVVNEASGEPVGRAMVQFSGAQSRNVMAGVDGHFELDNVPPGSFSVNAIRPGFAAAPQPQQIVVSPTMESVVVKLSPLSKISGTIVDREGEPVEGIYIQAHSEMMVNGRKRWQPSMGASTDEEGRFLIEDMPSGTYILQTNQKPLYQVSNQKSEAARYLYPQTFYPDGTTREMAQQIQLLPGSEWKADMTLHSARGAHVSVVTMPQVPNVSAILESAEGTAVGQSFGQPNGSGGFTFGAVAPGDWKIIVRGQFSGPTQRQDQEPLYGELPIQVGTQDLKDLKVPLSNLATISVQTAATSTAQASVGLIADSGQAFWSNPDPNGPMKIRTVSPGSYRLSIPPTGNSCVVSVTSGSQDLLREKLTVASGGQPPPIQITESANCGTLNISSNSHDTVYWVITSTLLTFEPNVQRSQNVNLANLTPAQYTVYAFDDISDLEYANPDVMRTFKSQTVDLEPGQTASVSVEVNERRKK